MMEYDIIFLKLHISCSRREEPRHRDNQIKTKPKTQQHKYLSIQSPRLTYDTLGYKGLEKTNFSGNDKCNTHTAYQADSG